jgi:hypothetical protein
MEYSESYHALKRIFAASPADKTLEGTEIRVFQFESSSFSILPGGEQYFCGRHNRTIQPGFSFYTDIGTLQDDVHIKDIEVTENQTFNYHIIRPQGKEKCKNITFLFHGFNEKDWTKYLTWAQAICKGSRSAVVLFPIAFHMQRAPRHWSSKRDMYRLSEERKKRFPNIIHSTLSNVAISIRLHSMPQRFIWSGLQTYYDIIQFIESCKLGQHPVIDKDFSFNIFAYSIGGFLAQILKLSNYNHYFDDTKVCLFCSGVTFNRLSPVSKFILDSEANVALYSFLVEHFDKMLERDSLLRHYITEDHMEGMVFHAMLDYKKMREYREGLLRKYENQIYAITLKKDLIIPSFEVVNTLQGAWRDIRIKVEEVDFDRDYLHENPFPVNVPYSKQVNQDFRNTFEKICRFLNQT